MIHVELSEDGQTIENVSFEGGCNGNLKAIGKLVAGQPVERVVEMVEGNTCGPPKTSCADQMTRALREAQGWVAEELKGKFARLRPVAVSPGVEDGCLAASRCGAERERVPGCRKVVWAAVSYGHIHD